MLSSACQCDFSRESSSIYNHWIQNWWQWPCAEFLGRAYILARREDSSRFGSSYSSLDVHGSSNVTFSHCAVTITSITDFCLWHPWPWFVGLFLSVCMDVYASWTVLASWGWVMAPSAKPTPWTILYSSLVFLTFQSVSLAKLCPKY